MTVRETNDRYARGQKGAVTVGEVRLEGREAISVGLWEFERAAQGRVAERAGIAPETSRAWFERAFGHSPAVEFAVSA